jgi:hypothetical protein
MMDWGGLAREVVIAGHNAVATINGYCAQVIYINPVELEGVLTQSSEHRIEFFDADFPGIANGMAVAFTDGRTFKLRELLPVDEVGLRKASLTVTTTP